MDTAKRQENKTLYRFGTFTLDASEHRLWRNDEALQLTPKQFELLHYFVSNAGRVTKKNDILDAVWPDTFVEETTLARNVSWLRKLIEGDSGKRMIETVPKVGYRFTPDVTSYDESEMLVVEEQTLQYTRSEETITIDTDTAKNIVHVPTAANRSYRPYVAPVAVILVLAVGIAAAIGYVSFNGQSRAAASTDGTGKKSQLPAMVSSKTDAPAIKIGSVVNLQNRYPNDGSYLDAWGAVWSKPEFKQVPTETMFVSTHNNPDRDNGSGSWEIVSANGKGDGEPLAVGDRIHLKNMYPEAGYLDACGWVEHLPVFDKFLDQTGAVFTTRSPNRDNGTGVWIIRSATKPDGTLVAEGDSIAIESSYFINDAGKNRVSGFLNVTGKVKDIPAFSEHDGAKLVFTQSISYDQPIPAIWTITISKAFSK